MNGDDEPGMKEVVIALSGLVEKIFSATLVAPAFSQVGLTIGDQVKLFRIKNLITLNEKLDRVIEERKLDRDDLKKLSLSVGFPLLEKASYQDDEFLQEKWANLLASSMEKGEGNGTGFSLDITFIEILYQLSCLDCEVLEYIVEKGILGNSKDGNCVKITSLNPLDLRDAFPDKPVHASLEKLVALGCVYRVLRAPIFGKYESDGYGSLAHDVVITMIGLSLYLAASGRRPKWRSVYIQENEVNQNTALALEK